MSRTSTFKALLVGSFFAVAHLHRSRRRTLPWDFRSSVQSNVVEAGFVACQAGTHPGYEGKYCWPNRANSCPYGFHLGYEGKYCWRD